MQRANTIVKFVVVARFAMPTATTPVSPTCGSGVVRHSAFIATRSDTQDGQTLIAKHMLWLFRWLADSGEEAKQTRLSRTRALLTRHLAILELYPHHLLPSYLNRNWLGRIPKPCSVSVSLSRPEAGH